MRKNALTSQGSLEGVYNLSAVVNGEKSWISSSKAIWSNARKNLWLIGDQKNIGTYRAGLYTIRTSDLGPDHPELIWYYKDKGWTKDSKYYIKIQCIDDEKVQKVKKITFRRVQFNPLIVGSTSKAEKGKAKYI